MTLHNLTELNYLNLLTALPDPSRVITGGICCVLLSWVMAKGQPGMAWITVQTHSNIIAVAVLLELGCIIVPEGIEVEEDTLRKADDEGVPVFQARQSAYGLAKELCRMGIE
jgi:putative Mn2+ efflux pump MntP